MRKFCIEIIYTTILSLLDTDAIDVTAKAIATLCNYADVNQLLNASIIQCFLHCSYIGLVSFFRMQLLNTRIVFLSAFLTIILISFNWRVVTIY